MEDTEVMHRRTFLSLVPAAGGLLGAQPSSELTPEELAKLLAKPENLFFLDVREPTEIRQLGSVKGYVNIPMAQLPDRLNEIPRNKLIITL
jgi:rhodanese-related sulfurtransferase